ncbi:MAG: mechanosensitive ion channel [Myxococcota bacterium]
MNLLLFGLALAQDPAPPVETPPAATEAPAPTPEPVAAPEPAPVVIPAPAPAPTPVAASTPAPEPVAAPAVAEPPAAVALLPSSLTEVLLRFGGALGILLVGWFLARLVSWLAFRALATTTMDDRLAAKLGVDFLVSTPEDRHKVDRVLANLLFWLVMLFVAIASLNQAGLSGAAMPLQRFLETVAAALPDVGKAALLLGAAWLAGRVVERVLQVAIDRSDFDRRFAELAAPGREATAEAEIGKNVGRVAFWLIMLVGLAGAFDALHIAPLAVPLRNLVDQIVGWLPTVGIAVLLVVGGWLLGRIARTVLQNLLDATGVDAAVERLRVQRLFAGRRASEALGVLAQAFIVLQAIIAALEQLGLRTLAEPLTAMMQRFWVLLPDLALAALFLAVGWVGGGIARAVATEVLKGLGFDAMMEKLGFGRLADRHPNVDEPSELAGAAVQGVVVLAVLAQVLDNLALETWAAYVNALLGYLVRNVAVSLGVLAIGAWIANAVHDLVAARQDGDPEATRWLAMVARYAVLVFAFTAAIRHLDVAEDFVLLSFGLLFGSLCLAVALAFGMGAKDVAGEIVRRQYDKVRAKIEERDVA